MQSVVNAPISVLNPSYAVPGDSSELISVLRRLREHEAMQTIRQFSSGIHRVVVCRAAVTATKRVADVPPGRMTLTTSATTTAHSLSDVLKSGSKSHQLTELRLSNTEDMVCNNIMCEKLGDPCVCKLARVLLSSRLPNVSVLDVSANRLPLVPDNMWDMGKAVTTLVLSDNKLTEISERVKDLQGLQVLRVDRNMLSELPVDALRQLPSLRQIYVAGNDNLDVDSLPQDLKEKVMDR